MPTPDHYESPKYSPPWSTANRPWFDYIFRGAPKPALLQDNAHVWKHAPSLASMAGQTLIFHLSAANSGHAYPRSGQKDSGDTFVTLKVDLVDHSDADPKASGDRILDKDLNPWNGFNFVSDPLPKATELSGLFSGRLDFVTN